MGVEMIGQTARTPEAKCLSCGELCDCATSATAECDRPEPGAITICWYCGHVMAYADDLTLRELNDAEMLAIAGDKQILAIQHLRGKLMQQDDHCVISYEGRNWRITGKRGHLLMIERPVGYGHCSIIGELDTSGCDWDCYCNEAVRWIYGHAAKT